MITKKQLEQYSLTEIYNVIKRLKKERDEQREITKALAKILKDRQDTKPNLYDLVS